MKILGFLYFIYDYDDFSIDGSIWQLVTGWDQFVSLYFGWVDGEMSWPILGLYTMSRHMYKIN